MTSRDFCYWLQGYFEIHGAEPTMTAAQLLMVKNHLALVFKHEIDPSMGGPAHQAELNAAHGLPDLDPNYTGRLDNIKYRC